MNIYNNLVLVTNPGEEKFPYNGKIYYRYMDRIYIPAPPCELTKEDVISLSEIRMQMSDSLINYDYTKLLIKKLIKYSSIDFLDTVIDFGCGGGILSDVIIENKIDKIKNVIGLDICPMAIDKSTLAYKRNNSINYRALIFNDDTKLDINSNSVGTILSSFVMHFNIYESQLIELYRLLRVGGSFIYNDYIYDKYPEHTDLIIDKLKLIGFFIDKKVIKIKDPNSKKIKSHLIVIAKKLIK